MSTNRSLELDPSNALLHFDMGVLSCKTGQVSVQTPREFARMCCTVCVAPSFVRRRSVFSLDFCLVFTRCLLSLLTMGRLAVV